MFFFIVSIFSCSISVVQPPVTIKELLPVGAVLQLTTTLTIPANRSYMYIAEGKVAPLKNYNTVDIYEPYCMIGFEKESPLARYIMPDTFKITRIIEREGYYSSNDSKTIEFSLNRKVRLIKTIGSLSDDSAPSNIMYATIISLYSDNQPEVKKIVCGHWDEPHLVEPLALKEMKRALGELIVINRSTGMAL